MHTMLTFMKVCNATPLRVTSMKATAERESDWPDPELRETQLNRYQIPPWKYAACRMMLTSGSPAAKYSLEVHFENGDEITLSMNQYDSQTTDSAKKQKSLQKKDTNHLQYGVMQRNGYWNNQHQTQYIITILYQNDQWMDQFRNTIANRPLRQICVLGTHDAGMSTLSDHTVDSSKANTLTQSKNIGQQLEYGVRYFELRPTIWPRNHGEKVFMGHVQKIEHLGIFGGLGESLDDVIDGVTRFYSEQQRWNEVAVLKFRSFDNVQGGHFDDKQKDNFKKRITRDLGALMFKAKPTDGKRFNLGNVTPQQVLDSGAKIICVFKDLNGPDKSVDRYDTSTGFFKYADYETDNSNPYSKGEADLIVADNYAKKSDWEPMAKDQLQKFEGFDPKDCAPFLLSWTLAEPDASVVSTGVHLPGKSIEDGANECNPYLWFTVWDQMSAGKLTSAKSFNILFADFVGGNLMNDCACAINSFLARP